MPVGLVMEIESKDINSLIAKSNAWSLKKRLAVVALVERYTQLIYAEAVRLVPVDTGNLRDSIYTALTGMIDNPSGEVITDSTHYAIFVEFGTKFMTARAYMRSAFKRYIDSFVIELEAVFETL